MSLKSRSKKQRLTQRRRKSAKSAKSCPERSLLREKGCHFDEELIEHFDTHDCCEDRIVKMGGLSKNKLLNYMKTLPYFLRNNKEFMLEAIDIDEQAYIFASNKLKNNMEIMMAAVSKNGLILSKLPIVGRDNKDIVTAAIKQNNNAIDYAYPTIMAKTNKKCTYQ